MKNEFSTNYAPNGEASEAVGAELPIHVTTREGQEVGALNITTEDGTRPIVAVTPHAAETAIEAETRSRKKQYL